MKREARSVYPPSWPACVACGASALDGHLTCGSVDCDEADARWHAEALARCERREQGNKVEYIQGIPFGPDPRHPHLNDWAQCQLCGDVVDVGGEMRDHITWHLEEKLEQE